jgi:pimeloyl-ACP methyl ester carboxylesterase
MRRTDRPFPEIDPAAQWVRVRSGPLYTRMAGQKVGAYPVVLIHGFVIASDYMLPMLKALAPWCLVYTLDLPGYGRSAKPRSILGLSQLADALAEWTRVLGLGPVQLIGNSFGCQIIAECAARHPSVVGRIVLQGPTIDARARTMAGQVRRLIRNSRFESPGLGWLMLRDYWRAGIRRIIATARIALRDRIETKLPRITAPTLIVRGACDPLVPQPWAEHLTGLLPRGRLLVMPGLAHTLNYTAPVPFVRAIRPFLQV